VNNFIFCAVMSSFGSFSVQDHFARRCDFAVREAVDRGIKPREADPLFDRFFRRLGVPVRPPHYRSFAANIVVFGWLFGTFWGIFMWIAAWSRQGMSIPVAVMTAVCAGLAFGVIMAAVVARKSRKAGLPKWDELPS
jgi:hypothetical protein